MYSFKKSLTQTKKMKKAKVLFVSQEITPYVEANHLSTIGRYLPQGIQEKGREIRTSKLSIDLRNFIYSKSTN